MGAFDSKNVGRTVDVISLYKLGSIGNTGVEVQKKIKVLSLGSYNAKTDEFKAVLGMEIVKFSTGSANNKLTVKVYKNGTFVTLADYTATGYFQDIVIPCKPNDVITYGFILNNDATGGTGLAQTADLDMRSLIVISPVQNCAC